MADENDDTERNENDDSNDAQDSATNESQNPSQENDNDSTNDSGNDAVAENDARLTRLESTLERVLGEISAIREAQGILVENGAVITDTDADMDFTDADSFVPPAEMNLLV